MFKNSAYYGLAKAKPVLAMALAVMPMLMLILVIAYQFASTLTEFAPFAGGAALTYFVALGVLIWHERSKT